MAVEYAVRGAVDDAELSLVHAAAFGSSSDEVVPWSDRLRRHSLSWVTAHDTGRLIGFVNVIGDGGEHAVLLDTVVDPAWQGQGVGRRLVATAANAARALGCRWLHVDFEDELIDFYRRACGFRATAAGLYELT